MAKESIRITSLSPWTVRLEPGYHVAYTGPLEAIRAANIIPKEFFNFGKSKSRRVCSTWFEKCTGKKCPERIGCVQGKLRAGGIIELELNVNGIEPIYIPPGDTWPEPGDPRFEVFDPFKQSNLLHASDEPSEVNGRIESGLSEQKDGSFRIRFSGDPQRLVNAGLMQAYMVPEGHTATGRKSERRAGSTLNGVRYDVSRSYYDDGTSPVNVWFGNVLRGYEKEFLEEVRAAHRKAAMKNAVNFFRKLFDADDNDDDDWNS